MGKATPAGKKPTAKPPKAKASQAASESSAGLSSWVLLGVVVALAVAGGAGLLDDYLPKSLQSMLQNSAAKVEVESEPATAVVVEPTFGGVPQSADLSACQEVDRFVVDDHREKGLHAVCMVTSGDQLYVTVKKDLNANRPVNFTIPKAANTQQLRWAFDELVIDRKPETEIAKKYQPAWQIFTTDGKKLTAASDWRSVHSLFLFEGGVWIYPAVRVGFKQYVKLDIGNITITTKSISPVVVEVSRLLQDFEMEHVINRAAPQMAQSGVLPNEGHAGKDAKEWRTSSNTWLGPDKVVSVIDDRVAELTHIPRSHQEYVQVLRYEYGQQYVAHHDYFDLQWLDKETVKTQGWEEKLSHGYANRLATVFWYMSDVEEGGETWFAQTEEEARAPHPEMQCKKELLVKPIRGGAIIFYSMLPNGETDIMSKHAGCPVKKGVKHAANKWVWSKPFHM
eukprot:comp21854_c1_seq1/m.31230 comp21854_c1_seq1/g.31230  ORF comp21854_c1_seq1/g.31230 comp21854_c1_seq1/m.31230 type:complete len:452 (-) comp21854_c1_seq1:387-1742(-)